MPIKRLFDAVERRGDIGRRVAALGSDEQIFGADEQVSGTWAKRLRDMSVYKEYQIVINGAQRRLIMRALTNAMANDRRSTAGGALTRPTEDEWMQLIRLFSTIKPSVRKPLP